MQEIKITLFGEPKGKEAPRRAHIKTKDGREFDISYTNKPTRNYEQLIKSEYHRLYPSVFLEGAIYLALIAYYPIPKSTSKKKRQLMLERKIRPVVKPDLSNCLKMIEDGLKGIAFRDDAYIVDEFLRKFYSDRPRVEITLKEWKP